MHYPTARKRISAAMTASWQGCLAYLFRGVFLVALSTFLFPFSDFRFPVADLQAAPVAYSGKIAVNGQNFNGPGQFRFQLIDQNGTVLWRNAPGTAAVTTAVNRGHYSVLLGDDATPNMAALPPRLFLDHPVVFLRVHFSEGQGKPFVHLQPDPRILSAAHALSADSANIADAVRPGGITPQMLSPEVLANLNAAIAAGTITRQMLSPEVLADLNASVIAPGSITREMLANGVLEDLNATIAPGSITRGMLSGSVAQDLNASVGIDRLPPEVKAFLAPRIVTQPPAQVTGYAERSIHIPAVADGRQLSYQWQRAGQPVAGATSPILHLADLNASTDPGSYSLVVTNPFGSVTSSATQLTVATVVPVDVDRPVLTLNGPKSISLLTDSNWTEPGYSATDDLDGDLTAQVDVNGTVNVSIPGAYFITYKATDSAGNYVTAQRVVTVSNFTDMCLIPAGTFLMGHGSSAHEVYVSAFYAGKYELTKAIWDEVRLWATDPARGANVYQFDHNGTAEGPDHPVTTIHWWDMVKWCNARSEKENLQPVYYRETNQTTVYRSDRIDLINDQVNWRANGWRLPTEAEWEKAARGGLVGKHYAHGNFYSPVYGNIPQSGFGKTVPVGRYTANGYGLHDSFGNVREWVWDGYQNDWYLQSEASLPNPRGPEHYKRSFRDASFESSQGIHGRYGWEGWHENIYLGFRLARNAPDAVAGGYPTLTSSPDANGTAGQAFSYQILAGNSPVAYGATGLPAGLSVNTSTGLISGTPTIPGEHNATISAANAAGTTSMSFAIKLDVHVPISAGEAHSFVIDRNGTIWATGSGHRHRLGIGGGSFNDLTKAFDENATAIATGRGSTLFTTQDGELWGMGYLRIATHVTPTKIMDINLTDFDVGNESHFLVKTDGSLWAWGENDMGQLGNGTTDDNQTIALIVDANVTQVSAGVEHALFVKIDGSLWGMGRNTTQRLGINSSDSHKSTPQMIVASGVASASAGHVFNLFVKTDGSLWGFGENHGNSFGNWGSVVSTPQQIVSSGVKKAAAGKYHSLFLKENGSLWGIGMNDNGQLGDDNSSNRGTPFQIIGSGVADMEAGEAHSMVVMDDGRVLVFGSNESGQLATNQPFHYVTPQLLPGLKVSSAEASDSSSYFIDLNGSLWSVGSDVNERLGNGAAGQVSSPVKVVDGNVTAVSSIYQHVLFRDTNGSLNGFGVGSQGRLASTTNSYPLPTAVHDGNVTSFGTGNEYSALVLSDGSLWAFGKNNVGQLGDGSTTQRNVPTKVVDANVTQVATGGQHTLYLKNDGSVWGTGRNANGQLADGTQIDRNASIRIIEANATSISCGSNYSLILLNNGSVIACGNRVDGRLGKGSVGGNQITLFEVASGDVFAIGAGSQHSFILKTDGSLWVAGNNEQGRTGRGINGGDTANFTEIVNSGVAGMSAGSKHSIYWTTTGDVYVFGDDSQGQLGLGRILHQRSPRLMFSSF